MKMTRTRWRILAREVDNIRRNEGRVPAIRHLRDQTGCGIKEAYDATKRLEQVKWSKV